MQMTIQMMNVVYGSGLLLGLNTDPELQVLLECFNVGRRALQNYFCFDQWKENGKYEYFFILFSSEHDFK